MDVNTFPRCLSRICAMSPLYLRCALCSRQTAEGLLSGNAWGRLELPAGAEVEHPALRGATLRACPTCIGRHPDWQQQLLVSLGFQPAQ
jgi:hypothetical protein